MLSFVESYDNNWLQCNQYNSAMKMEACNVLNKIHDFIFENPIDTGSIFDNWLYKLTLLLFLGFIISSLYTVFTEKPKPLKEIRFKIDSSWRALLNLIYATRLTQELHKRNEILKIEHMITHIQDDPISLAPIDPPTNIKEEKEDEFLTPINLETISTENISMKSVKTDHSTGSLIAAALSSQPKAEIPMTSDIPVSGKFRVPPISLSNEHKNKVQFNLTNSASMISDTKEMRSSNSARLSPKRLPPKKLIISKEDLIKLPEKQKPCNPRTPELALNRSSSAGEGTMLSNKGGIFEQRKKMFEKSETTNAAQRNRSPRSPKSPSSRHEIESK